MLIIAIKREINLYCCRSQYKDLFNFSDSNTWTFKWIPVLLNFFVIILLVERYKSCKLLNFKLKINIAELTKTVGTILFQFDFTAPRTSIEFLVELIL